jgi:hypothetical protein
MILAAKGLLDEEPRGSRSRIEEYLRGKMGAVQTAQRGLGRVRTFGERLRPGTIPGRRAVCLGRRGPAAS